MRQVNIKKILKLAKSYSENKIPWHHHFLTTKCRFNKTEKYQIVLENEKTGECYVAEFDHRPMEELEKLENIFFDRV